MTSWKEVRNQLLICSGEGVLNDHELLLLCDLKRSDILDLSCHSFPEFNFDDLETKSACPKSELARLAELYNGVNELINSKCLIRLASQISVPTDKDLSKPPILYMTDNKNSYTSFVMYNFF